MSADRAAPPRRAPVFDWRDGLLGAALLGLAWLIVRQAWALETIGTPPSPSPAVIASLRDEIARDPLDMAALRALGASLERAGQPARAEALIDFVGRKTWRDASAHAWLLARRLSQGRFDDAFAHADALLRGDDGPRTASALFPVMASAAGYEGPRAALATRLATRPPWRGAFLRHLAETGDEEAGRALLADLRRAGDVDLSEVAPFVARLVAQKAYQQAAELWSGARLQRDGAMALLRDGDFAGPFDQTAFGWTSIGGVGASGESAPAPGAEPGRALRIDYDGYGAPALPRQLLALPAGSYRLAWRERAEDGAPDSALQWTVRCAEDARALGRAGPLGAPPATGTWRDRTLAFAVPASGCAGQWVDLEASPGERRAPVRVWYRGLRVDPAG